MSDPATPSAPPDDTGAGTNLHLGDLRLRPWRTTDLDALVEACQDPAIARWVAIPQPYTPAEARTFIEEAAATWRDGTVAAFAIVAAETDELLGAVSRFGPDGHHATIGCWVRREARGRGVGTRSLRAVTDWTFATTDVIRMDAFILVGNTVSERMTERAGFRREGVLRAWELIRGLPTDCVVYSRLRTDRDGDEVPQPHAGRRAGRA
jgi:RimJ/RimL family protein N-acetyltransferase